MRDYFAVVARPKGAYQALMDKGLVWLTASEGDEDCSEAAPLMANLDDLYFVRVSKFLKIGRSRNLKERLRILSCHAPTPPELVGSLRGMGWQEKAWHMAFCDDRSHREWFKITRPLHEAVDAALRGEDWVVTLRSETWRSSVRAELARSFHPLNINGLRRRGDGFTTIAAQ